MVEGIWPERHAKIGTGKESANSICNREMTAFDRSILMGGMGASGIDGVTKFSKEVTNLRIGVELAALVKMDIVFVRTVGGMRLEKTAEPGQRSSLGDASVTELEPGKVIRDEDPAGFAIKTNKVIRPGRGLGADTSEGKIDGQTLERNGGSAGGIGTSRCLGLLGTNAGGANVEDGVHVVEPGNTFNVSMSMKR